MAGFYQSQNVVIKLERATSQFLNGLTSNAIDQPLNAFLNIHGRIIATFAILMRDDEIYIIIESSTKGLLKAHLERYLKISGVQWQEQTDQVVYAFGDVSLEKSKSAVTTLSVAEGVRLVITKEPFDTSNDEEALVRDRLEYQWPIQGIDYQDDFALNVFPERFVSMSKGCFLGQEPVSKVYHRSKARWCLQVRYEKQCQTIKGPMTSRIYDDRHNDYRGFVFEANQ